MPSSAVEDNLAVGSAYSVVATGPDIRHVDVHSKADIDVVAGCALDLVDNQEVGIHRAAERHIGLVDVVRECSQESSWVRVSRLECYSARERWTQGTFPSLV